MKGLKKSLGQNFFNNPTLADKIVNYIKDLKPLNILEIGPGDGYFTQRLQDFNLTLIEKDSEISQNLKVKFPSAKILNEDFLDIDLKSLNISEKDIVFGSLPYNVSKAIIRKLLEETDIVHFFFIIQKEVAQKYTGTVESKSAIYYLTKLFVDSKILLNISPGSFIPKPKVDSSFIYMQRNNNSIKTNVNHFLKITKQAFTNPRKTLKNNLKNYSVPKEFESKRGQELSFDEFITLVNKMI